MASLQSYWLKPWSVVGINTTGHQWWKTPVPLTPNNGVRAYTAQTFYTEYADATTCRGEIQRFTLNGLNQEGPFMGVAQGPGVSDVTFHIEATNAFATFFLIVDIFQ